MAATWILQTNEQGFLDDCRNFQVYGTKDPDYKSLQALSEGDTVFLRLQVKNQNPEMAYIGPYKATADRKLWVESVVETRGLWQKLATNKRNGPRWLQYFPWCVFLVQTNDFIDDLRTLNMTLNVRACEPITDTLGNKMARNLVQSDFLPESKTNAYRTMRGVWVRSRAEYMIDNWFTTHGIVTYYEKAIYLESHRIVPDWYIPCIDTFVEYLGLNDDTGYRRTWEIKERSYIKHGIKYITLKDADLVDLDRSIPARLPNLKWSDGRR